MAQPPQFDFEWDPRKAAANLGKHGVAFEEAARIFLDPHAVSLIDEEHAEMEERWITVGEVRSGRVLVVVHGFEGLDRGRFRVRLISARKATKRERRDYEERP